MARPLEQSLSPFSGTIVGIAAGVEQAERYLPPSLPDLPELGIILYGPSVPQPPQDYHQQRYAQCRNEGGNENAPRLQMDASNIPPSNGPAILPIRPAPIAQLAPVERIPVG